MFTLLGLHTVLFSCAPAVWQLRLNELCYVMLWSCVTSQRPTSYTDRLHTQRSRSHSSRTSVRAMWTFPLTCMCSEPELSSGSVQFIRWERRRHDVRRQTLAIACGALHVSPGGCSLSSDLHCTSDGRSRHSSTSNLSTTWPVESLNHTLLHVPFRRNVSRFQWKTQIATFRAYGYIYSAAWYRRDERNKI